MHNNGLHNEELNKTAGKECLVWNYPHLCRTQHSASWKQVSAGKHIFNTLVRFLALRSTQEWKNGNWNLILWESKSHKYFLHLYYFFRLLKGLFSIQIFLSQNTIGLSAKTQESVFSKNVLRNFGAFDMLGIFHWTSVVKINVGSPARDDPLGYSK